MNNPWKFKGFSALGLTVLTKTRAECYIPLISVFPMLYMIKKTVSTRSLLSVIVEYHYNYLYYIHPL